MGSTYDTIDSRTLEQALSFEGGPTVLDKAKLLMVQAVAALLNAAHLDINFALATQPKSSRQ